MNIVVTGGMGFLGQATIRAAIARGHSAWAFDHHLGHDVLGNLSDLALVGHPDVVIHLAGVLGTDELFDDIERAIQVNVTGAARVLDWCYRNNSGYVGITMPPVFPSVYTATKLAADRLASAYHNAYGLPVAHVRAYNAYGPGQAFGPGHPQKIIPTFAVAGWRSEPIPVWGDGQQVVDLVHADDVGRMLVSAAEDDMDDVVYDAGTSVSLTVKQVAEFVLGVTGSEAGIKYLPMRRGETMSRALSAATGLGWTRLDWRPVHSWTRVEETVRWYKKISREQ